MPILTLPIIIIAMALFILPRAARLIISCLSKQRDDSGKIDQD